MIKKIILVVLVFILIGIIGFAICKNIKNNSYIKLEINGQEIELTQENAKEPIDLQMLDSKSNLKIKVNLKFAKIIINGEQIKQTKEIILEPMNIKKENKLVIEAKKFGSNEYIKYQINSLPSSFPEFTTEGESEEEGEYYVTTYMINKSKEKHYIYKLNEKGEITFYKQTENIPFNFKKNEIDGKIRYTYLETTNEKIEGINNALFTKLVVLDENYNEIKRIGYLTKQGEISGENHDYLYLGENHYIIGGYTKEEVTNVPNMIGQNIKIWNCKIQEVENGEIVWEFESDKYPELYEYYNEENIEINTKTPYLNYMHFNSMIIDPVDENLICSFRNIDAIMKISRTTGKIIWILGGKGDQFGLTEEQKFSKQHSISLIGNHEILLYDNGCDKNITRVLIIKVNEIDKKIEKYESYELESFVNRMGAVRAVNEEKNIYLITHGIGNGQEYAFKEINLKTNEEKFKFSLSGKNILYCVNKYK